MSNQYQHLTRDFLDKFRANDVLPITCIGCGATVNKRKGDLLSNIKHNRNTFCTTKCCAQFQQLSKGRKKHLIKCVNCGEPAVKSSKDVSKCNNSFCSRKCSTTYNNKLRLSKQYIETQCGTCGKSIIKTKTSLKQSKSGKLFCDKKCSSKWATSFLKKPLKNCVKCSNLHSGKNKKCKQCIESENILLDSSTLQDTLVTNHFRSAQWAKVRGRARTQYKNQVIEGCENCGYKKHAEVCHIIAIPEFPLSTEVWRVNHKNNILILCGNCHWEADHNMLDDDAPVLKKLMSTKANGVVGASKWYR
jgi:hypothetical protein